MKIGIKSVGLVPQFVNFEAWKVTGSSSLTSAFSIEEDSESCRFWLLLFIFLKSELEGNFSNLSQRFKKFGSFVRKDLLNDVIRNAFYPRCGPTDLIKSERSLKNATRFRSTP